MKHSKFFTWLCDQWNRKDEVGELANFAVLDDTWPKGAIDKTLLRGHLRKKGQPALLKALSIALTDFKNWKEPAPRRTAPHESERLCQKMIEMSFLAWIDLDLPTLPQTVEMEKNGNPLARFIRGTAVWLGADTDEHRVEAELLWQGSANSGYGAPCKILADIAGCRGLTDERVSHLLRGARSGEKECAFDLAAMVFPNPDMKPVFIEGGPEAEKLIARILGGTGELEYSRGRQCMADGELFKALHFYERSAEMGYVDACRKIARIHEMQGARGKADAFRERGIQAGDPRLLFQGAARKLKDAAAGVARPEAELKACALTLVQNAENGVIEALPILAMLHYKGAPGIPKDSKKAFDLFCLLYHMALIRKDQEYAKSLDKAMNDMFVGLDGHRPLYAGLRWLFTTAKKTRSPAIVTAAARMWLVAGMELVDEDMNVAA